MLKKYEPFKQTLEGNWGAIMSHIIGNTLMGVAFFTVGLIMLLYANHSQNKVLTQWIGWCFILCAASRAIIVLSVWHAYYNIGTVVATVAGLACTVALVIMYPLIIKLRGIKDLEKDIEEQEIKLETLKGLKEQNDDHNSAGDMV